MREVHQTRGTLAREVGHVKLLTSISKAPARPHEVVAGSAEIVVDTAGVGGTGLSAGVEDIDTLAEGVEELDEVGVGVIVIGVSHDRCQALVLK
jgi:hypothetical protein